MTETGKAKKINKEEQTLLSALRWFLVGEKRDVTEPVKVSDKAILLADSHSVIPLVYAAASRNQKEIDPDVYAGLERMTNQAVNQSYHLFFETCRVVEALEEAKITVTVLKGVAVASFYPVFEYRKSGDIDILVNEPAKAKEAQKVLEGLGYQVDERQDALHQIVMVKNKGIMVELHVMLSEPFDNERVNEILASLFEDIGRHRVYRDILGFQVPILDDDYQAFELLIHMLQHFLRRGFGIKLLCDWVYYWNAFAADKGKNETDASRYMELIKLCGISGFSDMISAVCYHFLGLSGEAYGLLTQNKKERQLSVDIAEEFLLDILRGGEFGDDDKGRMVVLRSTSLRSYFIEFHHQMKLNHPKAGKYPILWPVLWCITLVVFLRNNKNIRNISSREIFQKAEKRSRLMKQMKLWQFK